MEEVVTMIKIVFLVALAFVLLDCREAEARPPSPTNAPAIELVRATKHVQTGPRGGRYYINKNGKKTYCGKKNPKC